MSNAVFPDLPGLQWGFSMIDSYSTLIYPSADPSYEVRITKQADPRLRIRLSYQYLRDDSNDELNRLRGFYRARQGSYDDFLLDVSKLTKKAADAAVVAQPLTLVGANLYSAPFVRTNGVSAYPETIYELNGAPVIYENGVVSNPALYVIRGPSPSLVYDGLGLAGAVVQFYTTVGHVTPRTPTLPLTADFSWYYRVRFEKDEADFDAWLFQLYELKELDLVVVRTR